MLQFARPSCKMVVCVDVSFFTHHATTSLSTQGGLKVDVGVKGARR
jgi:hypothetical protein